MTREQQDDDTRIQLAEIRTNQAWQREALTRISEGMERVATLVAREEERDSRVKDHETRMRDIETQHSKRIEALELKDAKITTWVATVSTIASVGVTILCAVLTAFLGKVFK